MYSLDGLCIDGSTILMDSFNLSLEQSDLKTNLLFTSHESAQNVCVAFKSDIIQFYSLDQKFCMVGCFQCPSRLTGLSVSKSFPLYKDLIENRLLTDAVFIIASYQNGTQGFINIQTFNNVITEQIPQKNPIEPFERADRSHLSKKIKYLQEFLIKVDQSSSGLIGVGLTNLSKLVVFRNPFFKDNNNKRSVLTHLNNLYEYMIFSGNDFWDLMMTTNPEFVDSLIESLENNFNKNLSSSMQKIYFSRHYSLMFSLYKRNQSYNYFRSQDILIKLILSRIMSMISFSIQLKLNMEQVKTSLGSSNSLSSSQIISVIDSLNQPNAIFNSSILNQANFRNNLLDYLNEILKVKPDANVNFNELKQLELNDIINAVLSRKNYQLCVNQQVKHILQWVIDLALYLINVILNQSTSQFGLSLLNDLWFLNEIRKVIVIVKLMIIYNAQNQINNSNLLINSVPVLPVKSSMQKDFLAQLFKLYSNIFFKNLEGNLILLF